MDSFELLAQTLDGSTDSYQVFFRDDDGGWADDRLQSLCESFGSMGLPLDIAVIPDALTATSVSYLKNLLGDSSRLFHIHQHGHTHVNHQTQGRSCEFGSDRTFAEQFEDIALGQQILQDYFNTDVAPIFTPPWNRCTNDTLHALEQLGFKTLSRITGSDPLTGKLVELPVTIDWLKKKNGARLSVEEVVSRLTRQFQSAQQVVGIMLHHEHMDRDNRAQFARMVDVLKQSNRIQFRSMLDVDAHNAVVNYPKGVMPL